MSGDESRIAALSDGDGFNAYQQYMLICLKGLHEAGDPALDDDTDLTGEARDLAERLVWDAERLDKEAHVAAVECMLRLGAVGLAHRASGDMLPGNMDGPPLSDAG